MSGGVAETKTDHEIVYKDTSQATPYEYFHMANAAYDVADREAASIVALKAYDAGWEKRHTLTTATHVRMQVFVHERNKQVVLVGGTAPEHWSDQWSTLMVDVRLLWAKIPEVMLPMPWA